MKEIPVQLMADKGKFGYYLVMPKYFYIVTSIGDSSSPWGLLRFNHQGIELCSGVNSRIAETDRHGKLQIIGIDIL